MDTVSKGDQSQKECTKDGSEDGKHIVPGGKVIVDGVRIGGKLKRLFKNCSSLVGDGEGCVAWRNVCVGREEEL